MVTTASSQLAARLTSLRDALYSDVYQSDIQDLLSPGIAHGICIGAKRKVARVNDARMLWELFNRIEPRAEMLARWDSWVLKHNFPVVVFWEPAHPPDIRLDAKEELGPQ